MLDSNFHQAANLTTLRSNLADWAPRGTTLILECGLVYCWDQSTFCFHEQPGWSVMDRAQENKSLSDKTQ